MKIPLLCSISLDIQTENPKWFIHNIIFKGLVLMMDIWIYFCTGIGNFFIFNLISKGSFFSEEWCLSDPQSLLWNHCLFFRWKSRHYLFQRISKRAKRSKDKIMNNPLQIPNEQGAARASSVSLATKRQKFHFNPLPLYTSSRPKRSQSSRQIRLWGKRSNTGPSEHKVQLPPPPSQVLAGIEEKHTPSIGLGFD